MHVVHETEHDHESAAWEAAVSSWMDGESELRAEELDTPYGRQIWETYHLIGDVLRSEELAVKPSGMFYARLSRAIDDMPPIVAPRPSVRGRWRAGWSGLAVAAAMAAVAWVAVPYFSGAPVNTLPAPGAQLASADSDDALYDYLDAHEGLVGGVAVRHVSYGGKGH